MKLHTLASGSEGNCLLVQSGQTRLLVDAGISTRRITAALSQLGLHPADISAIVLTHAHTDHVSALATWTRRYDTPLYASAATASQIVQRAACAAPRLHTVSVPDSLALGSVTLRFFPTAHDAWGSMACRIDGADGSIGVLTDTGYVTAEAQGALTGADLLVLESNHDVEMLRCGPYPEPLKARILGPYGHLSNETAARFAVEMAASGTREIVLAHLSRENNTPSLALETVARALRAADQESCRVSVAPRCQLSGCYEVEVTSCRK